LVHGNQLPLQRYNQKQKIKNLLPFLSSFCFFLLQIIFLPLGQFLIFSLVSLTLNILKYFFHLRIYLGNEPSCYGDTLLQC